MNININILQVMAASLMAGTAAEAVVEGKGKLMDNLSNYIIVDIGANLTNKKFSRDLDQVIQRATDSGEGGTFIMWANHFVPDIRIINHSMIPSNRYLRHLQIISVLRLYITGHQDHQSFKLNMKPINHSGVSKIMVTGTSLHSTKEALRLTRLYPDVLYSTAGLRNISPSVRNITFAFSILSIFVSPNFTPMCFTPRQV